MLSGGCINENLSVEPDFTPRELIWLPSQFGYQWVRNGTNLTLAEPFTKEIELTAAAILNNGAIVNFIMSKKVGTTDFHMGPHSSFNPRNSFYFTLRNVDPSLADNVTVVTKQFGDPDLQVQNENFTNYNTAKTIENHQSQLSDSLLYRVLSGGGFMRLFDINVFAEKSIGSGLTAAQSQIVNAFYQSIVTTALYVRQKCVLVQAPVLTTSTTLSTATSRVVVTSTPASTSKISSFSTLTSTGPTFASNAPPSSSSLTQSTVTTSIHMSTTGIRTSPNTSRLTVSPSVSTNWLSTGITPSTIFQKSETTGIQTTTSGRNSIRLSSGSALSTESLSLTIVTTTEESNFSSEEYSIAGYLRKTFSIVAGVVIGVLALLVIALLLYRKHVRNMAVKYAVSDGMNSTTGLQIAEELMFDGSRTFSENPYFESKSSMADVTYDA